MLDLQRSGGLVNSQATGPLALSVPTQLDATWAGFEAGDLDQNGQVNLADIVRLTEFLLGRGVPTPYQAFAADLADGAVGGQQVLNAEDALALLVKRGLTLFKVKTSLPVVHPLALQASVAQTGLLIVGNAGYGALDLQAAADQPWISLQAGPVTATSTRSFRVAADAAEGATGNVTLSVADKVRRTVPVTALAPTPLPGQITSQFTAVIVPGFGGLTFTKTNGAALTLSAVNPVWDAASHVFSADVTLENTAAAT